MTLSLQQLFVLHAAALSSGWMLFARSRKLTWQTQLIGLVIHMTCPMLVLVKGNQSVIYLIDLVAPLLAIHAFLGTPSGSAEIRAVTRSVVLLLIALPAVTGTLALALNGMHEPVGRRDIEETLLWFCRNVVFLSVFVLGARQRLNEGQALDFVKLILVLSGVSATLGMLSYFGPFNFAAFEQLASQRNEEWAEAIQGSRIGSGFLGLFRASVGQWYVCVVMIAVASLGVLKSLHRTIAFGAVALGIGVILLSYSRAGVLGLAAGLLVIAVVSGSRNQRFMALAAFAIGGLWYWFEADLIGGRVTSIVDASDSASQGRLYIWGRSLQLFSHDMWLLLAGTGPASRGRVFELIGGYGAHNEYIDIIFRMGIAGVFMLVATLILIGRSLWMRRKATESSARALCSGVFAAFVANCVMGLTQDHMIHDYAGHAAGVFLYFLYGTAIGVQARSTTTQAVQSLRATPPPNLMGAGIGNLAR